MALMCTMKKCGEKTGPCGHEKAMMLMVAMLVVVGGLGHFAFHWF